MMKKNETKKTKEKGKAPKKSSSGAGKGDKLRRGISQDEWDDRWERIFGQDKGSE